MKNSQKGFIAPLLLALIGVLIIGGGAYVYLQNKQANQPVTAQTSDLKTSLTDSEYQIALNSAKEIVSTLKQN